MSCIVSHHVVDPCVARRTASRCLRSHRPLPHRLADDRALPSPPKGRRRAGRRLLGVAAVAGWNGGATGFGEEPCLGGVGWWDTGRWLVCCKRSLAPPAKRMIHGRDGLLSFGMTPGPSKTAFAGYLLGSRSSRYALVATAIETSPLTLLMLVLPRSRDQLDCLRHCTDSLARFPVQTPPLPYLIQSSFPVGSALSLR